MSESEPGRVATETLSCYHPLGHFPFIVRKDVRREEIDEIGYVLGGAGCDNDGQLCPDNESIGETNSG